MFSTFLGKTSDISSEAVSPFIATYTAGDAVTEGRVKLLGDFEKTKGAENCKSVPKKSEIYSGTKNCGSYNRQSTSYIFLYYLQRFSDIQLRLSIASYSNRQSGKRQEDI